MFCPRCGEPTMRAAKATNSLSRRDNATYICSQCGTGEAMQDLLRILKHPSGMTVAHELRCWVNPPSTIRELIAQPDTLVVTA